MEGCRPRADSGALVDSLLTSAVRRLGRHMLLIMASGIYAWLSETAAADTVAASVTTPAPPTSLADAV